MHVQKFGKGIETFVQCFKSLIENVHSRIIFLTIDPNDVSQFIRQAETLHLDDFFEG